MWKLCLRPERGLIVSVAHEATEKTNTAGPQDATPPATKFICKSTLRTRGWTPTLIEQYVPVPDDERPNPHYRYAGAPMRLYDLTRIEAIEQSDEFQADLAVARRRQEAAAKAV